MSSRPPPLPDAALHRVTTIAKIDGLSLIVVAGLAAVISAVFGDFFGAVIGSLVCLAGWWELSGVKKLLEKNPAGIHRLIGSQLLLLLLIWTYVGIRLATRDESLATTILTPEIIRQLSQIGVDTRQLADLFKLLIPLIYIVVGLVSLIYQGGLAFYYHRQKRVIWTAFK